METQSSSPLNIDYLSHPAYGPYYVSGATETYFPKVVGEVCKTFDAMNLIETRKDLQNYFHSDAQTVLLNLQEIMLKYIPDNLARKCAMTALQKNNEHMLEKNLFRIQRKLHQNKKSFGSLKPLDDLKAHRISTDQISKPSLKTIREDLAPYINQIKASPHTLQFCHRDISLPMRGVYWSEVTKFLNNNGFLTAASNYLGYELGPWYSALGYARDSDTWWKTPYEKLRLPTTDLAYTHIDKGFEVVKCIIYLDEVNEENGPFSYFPRGSEDRMNFQDQLYTFLDHEWPKVYQPDSSNLNQHYRKWCLSTNFRKEFVNLPQFFRGSSHFGDDVLNGTDLSETLKKSEIKVVSDKANAFLFFGADLLHRGGMPEKGERLVLQLGFLQKRPFYKDIKKKAINTAYHLLGDKKFQAIKSYVRK